MNFEITTLAEMSCATDFIMELDNRGIDYSIEVMDNPYDADKDECTIMVDDMAYIFNDGELVDVAFATA